MHVTSTQQQTSNRAEKVTEPSSLVLVAIKSKLLVCYLKKQTFRLLYILHIRLNATIMIKPYFCRLRECVSAIFGQATKAKMTRSAT